MDERDMLEKIKESAQRIEVPETLKPMQVKHTLERTHRKKWRFYKNAAAAASIFLCLGIGGLAYRNSVYSQADNSQIGKEANVVQNDQDGKQTDIVVQDTETMAGYPDTKVETASDSQVVQEPPLKKIGNMYTLAADYGKVYDMLAKFQQQQSKYRNAKLEMSDVAAAEDVAQAAGSVQNSTFNNMLVKEEEKQSESTAAGTNDFSTTNLQVEGVDESDIVKTDGNYIYVVQEDQIQVLDVRNRVPEIAGTIVPKLNEDTDAIREMYVADQKLTLIIQSETSAIQEKQKKIEDEEDCISVPEYYLNTDPVTKVLTYDMTDPIKPVLKGTTTQDGWYENSRKIGNRLYLFTNKSMYLASDVSRKDAVAYDIVDEWIPCVNGKAVSADCIYLSKEGNAGILMSSMDLTGDHKVLDTKLLVNNYANIYVTTKSVYLYYSDYVNGTEKTRLARFVLDTDGTIRAKAAATLKGGIEDTFAIHERDVYLQVLTSVTEADPWENRVYVLDENMEKVGKLTGLAKGEMIYSARFTGEIGYFVTYRNTDPLFTVDFSNPKEPKIIGELKVTGFSDYLHFWDSNKLLGIGQETDPKTGNVIGIKLSMFDISNPAKVVEESKFVMKDADECEAMYHYKTVLVHLKKNIIAFTTQSWAKEERGYQKDYRVFSYQDGTFISRLERPLTANQNYDTNDWRSVYVGDILYAVSPKKAIAFDMADHFKEIGKVKYVK